MRPGLAAPIAAAFLAAAPTAQAAPERCHTNELRASLHAGSPGAGQRYAILRLTNRGPGRCTIFGYAGAQLLRSDGRRVPTRVVRDRSRTPSLVTLRPGQHAAAGWHWGAIPGAGDSADGPCQPLARTALITPPDETRPLRRRWRLGRVCQGGRIDERPFSGPYG
jgi:hypothetical protein